MTSLPDLLSRVRGLPAAADLRAYLRYLARHPFDAVTRRPVLTGALPPYLEGFPHRPTPLEWVPPSDGLAVAQRGELAVAPHPNVDWDRSFQDREDLAALHRFTWLLPWLVSSAAARHARPTLRTEVLKLAQAWRTAHPQPSTHEAWQPYTVSERLANWFWGALCGSVLHADELGGVDSVQPTTSVSISIPRRS